LRICVVFVGGLDLTEEHTGNGRFLFATVALLGPVMACVAHEMRGQVHFAAQSVWGRWSADRGVVIEW